MITDLINREMLIFNNNNNLKNDKVKIYDKLIQTDINLINNSNDKSIKEKPSR